MYDESYDSSVVAEGNFSLVSVQFPPTGNSATVISHTDEMAALAQYHTTLSLLSFVNPHICCELKYIFL